MTNERHGPLHGVRVLEFGIIFAGPVAGMQLSDFGAEVIKVEQPPGGEEFRYSNTLVPGHSKAFQALNRGKQSLIVDLASDEGREVIYRLMPSIDVVIINFRPGVAERLQVDYETLRQYRADLIYGQINGFGAEGPLAHLAASDIVAQAYGGTVAVIGKLDDDAGPVSAPVPIGDGTTGMNLAMGVLAALYHRSETGDGQYLAVSLLRSVMSFINFIIMVEPVNDASARDIIKAKIDRVRAAGGSYDKLIEARQDFMKLAGGGIYFSGYRAKDGGLVTGALTPRNRDAFRKVFEIENDPFDDEGFDPSLPESQARMDEIQAFMRERLLTKTVDEWLELFDEAGAPGIKVNIPEDLPDDPQAKLHFRELVHEVTGPQLQVKPVVDMDRSPTDLHGPAPLAGADTERLLRELAGYSAEEVSALNEQGSVVVGPL